MYICIHMSICVNISTCIYIFIHTQRLDRDYGIALLKKRLYWVIAGVLGAYTAILKSQFHAKFAILNDSKADF